MEERCENSRPHGDEFQLAAQSYRLRLSSGQLYSVPEVRAPAQGP